MSIGQSIMQAARPRTMIAPLQVYFNKDTNLSYLSNFLKNIVQIGLGVQLHSQSLAAVQGKDLVKTSEKNR